MRESRNSNNNFCVLEPNNNLQCSRTFRDLKNNWEPYSFAGTCYKGQCMISPTSNCPDQYRQRVESLKPCIYTSIKIGTSEPIAGGDPLRPGTVETENGLCA